MIKGRVENFSTRPFIINTIQQIAHLINIYKIYSSYYEIR